MRYIFSDLSDTSIKEMPVPERPRERLQTEGVQYLSDTELLCAILGRGVKGHPVQKIAKDILDLFFEKNGQVSFSDLLTVKGLGSAQASLLCASLELGRRLFPKKRKTASKTSDAFNLIRHFGDQEQEHFLCLELNGALEVIHINVVSKGILNKTLVHSREVFAQAIADRAAAIIIAHNHPSGNLQPSENDFDVTCSLVRAGKILGIEVLDHIIFSDEDYFSMRESGEFPLF